MSILAARRAPRQTIFVVSGAALLLCATAMMLS
jgi:hypothetical protein